MAYRWPEDTGFAKSTVFRDKVVTFWDGDLDHLETWFCNLRISVENDRAFLPSKYHMGEIQILVRSAELVVPILDLNPIFIRRVRAFVAQGSTVASVLNGIDRNHDGAFTFEEVTTSFAGPALANHQGFGGYDIDPTTLPAIPEDEPSGDPGLLFSCEGLRALSYHYASSEGVANALQVKLNAAETVENASDLATKASALQSFRDHVRAQSGKKITPQGVHVLTVLSRAL